MDTKRILLLGGYGAVGRTFAKLLLQETLAEIIIAGRREDKAKSFAESLAKEFPDRNISSRFADASVYSSLVKAFQNIDLVVVLTTTPPLIKQIGKAALEANCDYLDILVSDTTITELSEFSNTILEKQKTFITQAGFHPGLPAVFIRFGAKYFDTYEKAAIGLAMNARFETAEQAVEIVHLISEFNAEIYRNGSWGKSTYKDARPFDLGKKFGKKTLFPLQMEEVKQPQQTYNLKEVGVYVSGFNWVTDYFVMPLIMLTQKIKKGFAIKTMLRLFTWSVNRFSSEYQGVVFVNDAEGMKNGKRLKIQIKAEHESAYLFTAIPVIACLKQYLEGKLSLGLNMMGHVVDDVQLFEDMEKMGVEIEIKEV